MTLLIVATLLVLAALTTGAPRAAIDRRGHCPRVRAQIVQERVQTWRLQRVLDVRRSRVSAVRPASCAYAKWVHSLWEHRHHRLAKTASYRVLPATKDWQTAVKVAQRVYPNTAQWLLSCSAAEGGHGRWVRYGGGSYYPGYEHTDAVGGWMQFRPSTFYGSARHSYDFLRSKGFRVSKESVTGLAGWFSPLGQALAAGYLRNVAGSSRWHWAASISAGCA